MTAFRHAPPARSTPNHPGACVRCGAQLLPLARRRQPVCRVCATREAQSFLRQALANRRRRPPATQL